MHVAKIHPMRLLQFQMTPLKSQRLKSEARHWVQENKFQGTGGIESL